MCCIIGALYAVDSNIDSLQENLPAIRAGIDVCQLCFVIHYEMDDR